MKLLAFRALCVCVLTFCLPATFAAGVQWDPDGSVHPANRLNPHFRNLMVTSNTTLRQLTVTNTITAGGLVVSAPTFSSFVNAPHNHQDAAGGAQLNASSVFSAGTIPTARLGSGTANNTTFLRGDSTWQTGTGGGSSVFVKDVEVSNPNFENGTNSVVWSVDGTNVYGFPTNILGNQITDGTITAADLADAYVVGPSSSTNNNLVRFDGATGKLIQDSSVNVEDDGDILTPGSVSTGVGGSDAGALIMVEGAAPALTANGITFYAPVDVAAGGVAYIHSGTAGTGFQLWTDSSGVMTGSIVGFTGFGDVVRATGPTISDPIFTSTMFFEGLIFTIEGAIADGNETFFEFGEPSGDATYEFDTTRMSTPGAIDVGHISDTTLERAASGFLSVEGKRIASPASAAAGDVMYFNGTEWVRLAKGTAGQVLEMNSGETAPEWDTDDSGAGTPALVQVFTNLGPNTWTNVSGAKSVYVQLWGGGSGGGSGRKGAAGEARVGGGGGGGGGTTRQWFPASTLGATETVTVGGGGPGGAAVTSDNTSGANGSPGTNTTFGTWLRAGGGVSGGAGGGNGSGGTAGAAGSGEISGLTGGAASTAGALGAGGSGATLYSGAGGGAGGGISTGDAASNGGVGGGGGTVVLPTGLTGGTVGVVGAGDDGGAGTSAAAGQPQGAAGGGGGASSITGGNNAGNGGAGGFPSGGGGGGGAGLNSTTDSGAGGTGGRGMAIVITYF